MKKDVAKKILKLLIESYAGLAASTLYGRANLEFKVFTQALLLLEEEGYILNREDFIRITSKGKEQLLQVEKAQKRQVAHVRDEEFYTPNVNRLRLSQKS